MKSSYGHNIKYTLFGESHSIAIGITIEGLPAGFEVDFSIIDEMLLKRQGQASFNTPRQEKVSYNILSGFFEKKLTGSPLTIVFANEDLQSKDYSHLKRQPRPGHADYVARHKYKGANDYRGGGHFSGRLTAPIVFLGGLIKQIIKKTNPNFKVISHINTFQEINDLNYYQIRGAVVKKIAKDNNIRPVASDIATLAPNTQKLFAKNIETTLHKFLNNSIKDETFPTLDYKNVPLMIEEANKIKKEEDTAGGQIETIIINAPAFIGEPFFTSIESTLSSLLYSIPSVKSVDFGIGDLFAIGKGSNLKDEIIYSDNQRMVSLYNYNGGINGGISNGEDIVLKTVVKPIASLQQSQATYSNESAKIESLEIGGRHDSTIINRVIPIIDSMVMIGLYDLMLEKKKDE